MLESCKPDSRRAWLEHLSPVYANYWSSQQGLQGGSQSSHDRSTLLPKQDRAQLANCVAMQYGCWRLALQGCQQKFRDTVEQALDQQTSTADESSKEEGREEFCYVELSARPNPHWESSSLDNSLDIFTNDPVKRACVLVGQPGSGKTLSCVRLHARLIARQEEWLVSFVFPSRQPRNTREILSDAFRNARQTSDSGQKSNVLIVVDGFDQANDLENDWTELEKIIKQFPLCKLIVTSREDALPSPYLLRLIPGTALQWLYVQPIDFKQTQNCLCGRERMNGDRVIDALKGNQSIMQALTNPLMLQICLSQQNVLNSLISRQGFVLHSDIIEQFIELNCQEDSNRLGTDKETVYKVYTLLAFEVVHHGWVHINSELSLPWDSSLNQRSFDCLSLLVSCKDRAGNTEGYCFLQASYSEHLVVKQLIAEVNQLAIQRINEFPIISHQAILDQFLKQVSRQKEVCLERLLMLLLRSRQEKEISQASGNAMTLLNCLGYEFANQNFSGIQVKNANLSGADLSNSDFSFANLESVQLEHCKFFKTSFKHSILSFAELGIEHVLLGHFREVKSVCFSPDNTKLASGDSGNTAVLWDATTGKRLHTLQHHSQEVSCILFSPDGACLVTCSFDGHVVAWDISKETIAWRLHAHNGWVTAAAFARNGSLIITVGEDTVVSIWNTTLCQKIHSLREHSYVVSTVAVSPDELIFATGSWDNTIIIWNLGTGENQTTLEPHKGRISAVSFSPDGTLLATSSFDGNISLWETTEWRLVRTVLQYFYQIRALSFSPDGLILASASSTGDINLWEVSDIQHLTRLKLSLLRASSVCFSSDGTHIAFCGLDKRAVVWKTPKLCEKFIEVKEPNEVSCVCFSPDNSLFASGDYDWLVRIWEPLLGKELFVLRGHLKVITTVCFSPDSELLASGSGDHSVVLWTVKTGQTFRVLSDHPSEIVTAMFSSDNATIVCGCLNSVFVWDIATGQQIRKFSEARFRLKAIAFQNNELICSGCDFNEQVMVWGPHCELQSIPLSDIGEITQMVFSHDRKYLAYGSEFSGLFIWDFSTKQQFSLLEQQDDMALSVCFSPDSRMIASGNSGNIIIVWLVSTLTQIWKVPAHHDYVTALCFSADATLLVSGSADRTIKVWRVPCWSLGQLDAE